jgi:hypothetical protein
MTGAFAADCPQPAMTGVTATPTSLIGGNQNFNITLTFVSNIPSGCFNFYSCSSSNNQAASAGICPANFVGDGTNKKTLVALSKVGGSDAECDANRCRKPVEKRIHTVTARKCKDWQAGFLPNNEMHQKRKLHMDYSKVFGSIASLSSSSCGSGRAAVPPS